MMGLRVPLETIQRNNREGLILGDVSRWRRNLGLPSENLTDAEYDALLSMASGLLKRHNPVRSRRDRLIEIMVLCLSNIDRIDLEGA